MQPPNIVVSFGKFCFDSVKYVLVVSSSNLIKNLVYVSSYLLSLKLKAEFQKCVFSPEGGGTKIKSNALPPIIAT